MQSPGTGRGPARPGPHRARRRIGFPPSPARLSLPGPRCGSNRSCLVECRSMRGKQLGLWMGAVIVSLLATGCGMRAPPGRRHAWSRSSSSRSCRSIVTRTWRPSRSGPREPDPGPGTLRERSWESQALDPRRPALLLLRDGVHRGRGSGGRDCPTCRGSTWADGPGPTGWFHPEKDFEAFQQGAPARPGAGTCPSSSGPLRTG